MKRSKEENEKIALFFSKKSKNVSENKIQSKLEEETESENESKKQINSDLKKKVAKKTNGKTAFKFKDTKEDENKKVTKKKKKKEPITFEEAIKQSKLNMDQIYYTEECFLFSPLTIQKLNGLESVEVVGIDVGSKHLAIFGFQNAEEPIVCCFVSLKITENSHMIMDQLMKILLKTPEMKWLQKAKSIHIEQQMGFYNIPAYAQSVALRVMFITHNQLLPENVRIIHADNKYKIAPLLSLNLQDPIRLKKNTSKITKLERKKLAINDVKIIIENKKWISWQQFLESFAHLIDKLDDCCDSFLLAYWYFVEDQQKQLLKEKRKKSRKTKTLV